MGFHLNVLPETSHENVRNYYWNADVVMDRFKLGSLGKVSLEAIACGRPVITYVSSAYDAQKKFPLKNVSTVEEIVETLGNVSPVLWEAEYAYVKEKHNPTKIAKSLVKIYMDVMRNAK